MTVDQQTSLLGKVAAYTEILIKDPSSTIFVSLAEIYRKMGLFADARQILASGLEKHPDLAAAYVVLARIECQQGDYDKSCISFETALKLDAESLAALVGFARVKILLEHYDDARKILLTARDLSPADPVINKLILSLPEKVADLQEPDTDVLHEDSPTSAAIPFISATIAELHLKQGMREEALTMFRQLLEKDPDNLELRRKIREIENAADGIEDLDVKVPEEADSGESGYEICDENITETTTDVSAGSPSSHHSISDNNAVLVELNRLLSNIEKRREHV